MKADFCQHDRTRNRSNTLCFIYSYPASQAALANTHKDRSGQLVAGRFELYWRGIELANGCYELTDAKKQHKRFGDDKHQR